MAGGARGEGLGAGVCSYSQRPMAAIARDERAWLRRARAGSASDLEALFRLHWPRAYRVAYLIVHEHVAAEEIARSLGNAVRRRGVAFVAFSGGSTPWAFSMSAMIK